VRDMVSVLSVDEVEKRIGEVLSSHKMISLFGVLLLVSFIAAYEIHVASLVSVWCFFAALLSLIVYYRLSLLQIGEITGPYAHSRQVQTDLFFLGSRKSRG
jgi:uncharacterized membrane protein